MFKTCKHKWVVLDKTILPSSFEILKEHGGADEALKFLNSFSGKKIPEVMLSQLMVLTLSCEHCGKLDQTTKRTVNYTVD